MTGARTVVLLLALLALIGCAQRENIPTYPPMEAQQALDTILQRSAQIDSVSGEGAITLTGASGRSVRLEAAFVLAPPDRARVRAWKFGQAVLDLTVLPEGTWMFLPRDSDDNDRQAEQLRGGSSSAGRALREWLRLLAGRFDAPESSVRISGSRLLVTRPTRDRMTLVVTIDRNTLTPRKYALCDAAGRERFSLSLAQYRVLGAAVWPSRIEAQSDTGKVRIEMRDVELNAAAAAAFKPPARAQRVDVP